MRWLGILALAIKALTAGPALANGTVTIVDGDNSSVGLTVRIDGEFGCRVEPRDPYDTDFSRRCSFEATEGSHKLELDFDGGASHTMSITVTSEGLKLILPKIS